MKIIIEEASAAGMDQRFVAPQTSEKWMMVRTLQIELLSEIDTKMTNS